MHGVHNTHTENGPHETGDQKSFDTVVVTCAKTQGVETNVTKVDSICTVLMTKLQTSIKHIHCKHVYKIDRGSVHNILLSWIFTSPFARRWLMYWAHSKCGLKTLQ